MTTTSNYSGQLGERESCYVPDWGSGVIGETPLVAVDVSGEGVMGDKFV